MKGWQEVQSHRVGNMEQELLRLEGKGRTHGEVWGKQTFPHIISSSLKCKLPRLWGMHGSFLGSCAFNSVHHGSCGEGLDVEGRGSHLLGWCCGSRGSHGQLGSSHGRWEPGLLVPAQHLWSMFSIDLCLLVFIGFYNPLPLIF